MLLNKFQNKKLIFTSCLATIVIIAVSLFTMLKFLNGNKAYAAKTCWQVSEELHTAQDIANFLNKYYISNTNNLYVIHSYKNGINYQVVYHESWCN